MAHSLRDLELLMDHNTNLTSSTDSRAKRGVLSSSVRYSPTETPLQAQSQEIHQALRFPNQLEEDLNPHFRPSLMASLSMAIGPVISLNSSVFRNRALVLNPTGSSAVKFPSQKKCISPVPLTPAISASTTSLDTGTTGLTTRILRKLSSAFPDYSRLPEKSNYQNPNNGGALRKASIVWFRSDLRCHDNEALSTASKESLSILPVYVFDPREFGKSCSGFDKTGPHRARFLLQCVSDLREKVKELGSDLVVRIGNPEEVLLKLAKAVGADALYAHQDVSYEGMQTEKKVSAALQEEGVDTKFFWGNTLFHIDDLPFKLGDLPATYSPFHERVSKIKVRDTIETPKQLKALPIRGSIKPGDMPTLEELGVKSLSASRKGTSAVPTPLIGGEKEALERLGRLVSDYARQSSHEFDTTSSLHGSNFSSKISPWLSLGCLSPRRALEAFSNQGNSIRASKGSNMQEKTPSWLFYELLWRDFFRFVTKKQASARPVADFNTCQTSTVVTACS
ncbi:hypothetical protein KP509_09G000300 [Ceratopteris richardii]|uniref:Photolyase/cryptochrome alpha/beta domain-containing protein n=1 Tax=Ceratopteris richardii TaxID=49495 RepID=A0A8T2TY31_CERRI|nr:hypothetical protein KP509_09G000300 [Ceratopteris richardii]KAH7428407.1 hypothetical protein KP509_09G000300 [Ceratopteris richardii]